MLKALAGAQGRCSPQAEERARRGAEIWCGRWGDYPVIDYKGEIPTSIGHFIALRGRKRTKLSWQVLKASAVQEQRKEAESLLTHFPNEETVAQNFLTKNLVSCLRSHSQCKGWRQDENRH